MQRRYSSRLSAGQALAAALKQYRNAANILVVALPRGGVPVAAEVARLLGAPLDVGIIRKIGAPGHTELACGAVAADGSTVWNERVLFSLGLTQAELRRDKERALQEARQLEQSLRTPSTPPLKAFAKTVILVDDGLATGATMKAALKALLLQKPHKILVAVPVAPDEACSEIENMGYEIVCPKRLPPGELSSVGEWYDDFSQVESAVCRRMLEESRAHPSAGEGAAVAPN